MTFSQKLEYLSTRKMLVFFSQEDGFSDYVCNIAIVRCRPVKGRGATAKKAFEAAFNRAVFKLDGLKLAAN